MGVRSFRTAGTSNTPAVGALLAPAADAAGVSPTTGFTVLGGDNEDTTIYTRIDVCSPSFSNCDVGESSGWKARAITPGASQSDYEWLPSATLPAGSAGQWRAWVWDGVSRSSTNLGVRSFATKTDEDLSGFLSPAEGAQVFPDSAFAHRTGSAATNYYQSLLCFPSIVNCTSSRRSGWSTTLHGPQETFHPARANGWHGSGMASPHQVKT